MRRPQTCRRQRPFDKPLQTTTQGLQRGHCLCRMPVEGPRRSGMTLFVSPLIRPTFYPHVRANQHSALAFGVCEQTYVFGVIGVRLRPRCRESVGRIYGASKPHWLPTCIRPLRTTTPLRGRCSCCSEGPPYDTLGPLFLVFGGAGCRCRLPNPAHGLPIQSAY